MTVVGHDCNDITLPPGSVPYKLERGTETSYNNSPDFTHEFDSMKFKWDDQRWYNLQSFFGIEYVPKIDHGYFVDSCGSSREDFYHIETGKGTARNCWV